ncbi:hypothetical protein BH11PSE9_BH11PSE9_26210 [soil metagenome]
MALLASLLRRSAGALLLAAGCMAASAAADTTPAASPFPEVLALVTSRDPQVRSAREALNALIAQAGQAQSRLFPRIGLSTNYGRSQESSLGLPFSRSTNRTEAYLRWNLFNGLADKTTIDATDRERLAAIADLQRAIDEACQRSIEAYFDWLRLSRQSERSALRVTQIGALAERVRQQWVGGKATEGDSQLAASALIDAQFAHETLVADREAARVKIETLAGTRLGLPLPWALPTDAAVTAGFELPLDDALAQARLGNGQWRAAEERAEAARLRLGVVPADYLPKLDLDVRRRVADHTAPALDPAQRGSWSLQLTYEIPLGGEIGYRRDELRAKAQAALADADRVGQGVRSDLAATRFRAQQARAALEPLQRQTGYLQDVVRTSELQYDAGRRSLLQLIQLRDQRFTVEQRSADNDYRLLSAQSQWLALSGALAQALGIAVPQDVAQPVAAAARRDDPQ